MDERIYKLYEEYQSKYGLTLPKITKIIYIGSSGSWARFLSEDLYSRKYILHVNESLYYENDKFIRQILFHEFTHLTDSIDLLHTSINDFKNIMISYSEFHASKIEMIERLDEVNGNINLNTDITHAGILPIRSFMDQTFQMMKNDLSKMNENGKSESLFYNTAKIYYFYGYLSALEKYKVNYKFDTKEFPDTLKLILLKLQSELMKDKVNKYNVGIINEELNGEIKNIIRKNMLKRFGI